MSRPVRPRTRAGRLSALDAWLNVESVALLTPGATLIDFGFGESAVTTEEWAEACSGCRVIGIDARAASSSRVELVVGDFDACARFAPVSVLRAMNVVRAYREDEVETIRAQLGACVIDGGLVIDGSTDTEGHVLSAWLLRKTKGALVKESLLFHTDFSRGFSPWLFRDWLPRDLRRSVKPGTWIHEALTKWDARASGSTPRERFEASLGDDLLATGWEREHGYCRLTAS
ncbi:MAG: methylase [Archangium sp.]